jgi:integrase/recombinase XerD
MLNIRKRSKVFAAEGYVGGKRTRVSLGTRDQDSARRLLNKIERAIAEGTDSPLWLELRAVLPQRAFPVVAQIVGWQEKVERPEITWADLLKSYEFQLAQRVALRKLASSTVERYQQTLRQFTAFLSERGISDLRDITRPVVEAFKVWRADKIRAKKFARGATSVALDAAILHSAFSFAVESEMVIKNPVRMEGKPGAEPARGAQPFTGGELQKLRAHAGADLLAFLLLRHTGFRGSDAVRLSWAEVHFDRREIERVTQKRRKRVILPIHTELLFALETEFARRAAQSSDVVLALPNGNAMTRPRLYERIKALGERAEIPNAHPHRFRDTLAVDLLCAGCGVYDVARMLGDTVETIERHYAPFVPALRERVRRIMESGTGIESTSVGANSPQSPAKPEQVQ